MKYETTLLEDVLARLIDYRGKTPMKTESGVRLITAKVIKSGRIIDADFEFIADHDYDGWMRRGLPQHGDLLVTTEAPLGEVAELRTTDRVALAQRVILLRADPSKMDQRFMFHSFRSPFVQAELERRATGTTVKGIKQSELRRVRLPFPSLPIQRRIASILSAYDDLIENNTKRIKILEEMARAVYREWFVHFRFPSHEKIRLVDSSVGQIPEGWQVAALSQIADVNAASIRNESAPDTISYVDIQSVSIGSIDSTEEMPFASAPSRARRIARDGDVIWSTVRPGRRSYALVLNPPDNLVVSTGFAVLSPREVPSAYLYFLTTQDDFVTYLVNHARGAAYPAVTGSDFQKASVLVPDDDTLRAFDHAAEPMLRQRWVLQSQNQVLRQTRDLLLPRLISGELDVSTLPLPEAP